MTELYWQHAGSVMLEVLTPYISYFEKLLVFWEHCFMSRHKHDCDLAHQLYEILLISVITGDVCVRHSNKVMMMLLTLAYLGLIMLQYNVMQILLILIVRTTLVS